MIRRQDTHGQISLVGKDDWTAATLRFEENERPIVEFDGSHYYSLRNQNINLIGNFNGIGKMALVNSRISGSNSGYGTTKIRVQPQYLISKMHISSVDQLLFHGCSIDMDTFGDWYDPSFYTSNYTENRETTITIYPPEDLLLNIPDSIKSFIRTGYNFNCARDQFDAKRKLSFYIEYDKALPISHFVQVKHRLRQILMLLSGENHRISINTLAHYDDTQGQKQLTEKGFFQKEQGGETNYTMFEGSDFDSIKEHFPTYLGQWIVRNNMGSVGDLLLSRYSNPYLDVEAAFLNSCFAAESIHRKLFDYEEMPKSEYKKHLQSLKNFQIDKEFLTLLKTKAAYGYQPSLRARLNNLLDNHPESSKYLSHRYAQKITKMRNTLAHQLTTPSDLQNFDLQIATEKLDNFLKQVLLFHLQKFK